MVSSLAQMACFRNLYSATKLTSAAPSRPVISMYWSLIGNAPRFTFSSAKNLAFARTPFELAAELRALTESNEHSRSMIAKHQRRVAWLNEHLVDFIAWANLDPSLGWTVASAVVVDEHAMSPKLRDVGEPVFSLDELQQREDDFGLSNLCASTYAPYAIDPVDENI